MMPRHRYSVEEPVRLSRSWATALSGLVGIGLGIAAAIVYTTLISPPPPPPAPLVVVPSITAPVAAIRPEFDALPWVSTLRTGMIDLNSSLGAMPVFKAPAYKTPFEAITTKAQALDASITQFELAVAQHKTQP